MAASIPGAGIEAKEPDEFTEWNRMDPSLASPLVAWLASDKAGHVTGQVIRAVGDEIVLMTGWSNGNTIRKPEKRWEPSELTALMNADIFHSRAPARLSLRRLVVAPRCRVSARRVLAMKRPPVGDVHPDEQAARRRLADRGQSPEG